jgi:hypothetical protein
MTATSSRSSTFTPEETSQYTVDRDPNAADRKPGGVTGCVGKREDEIAEMREVETIDDGVDAYAGRLQMALQPSVVPVLVFAIDEEPRALLEGRRLVVGPLALSAYARARGWSRSTLTSVALGNTGASPRRDGASISCRAAGLTAAAHELPLLRRKAVGKPACIVVDLRSRPLARRRRADLVSTSPES